MGLRTFSRAAALALMLFASAHAQTSDPEERVKIGSDQVCSKVLGFRHDECKRKHLSPRFPPVDDVAVVRLTDFLAVRSENYTGNPLPPQAAYGRVKVSLVDTSGLAAALSAKGSVVRRLMPKARGVLISVSAKAINGGATFDVLPTTPIAAYDAPLPGTAGNTRTLVNRLETRSAWLRLDAGTQFDFTLSFDGVDETKFVVFSTILNQVAGVYTAISGDQLIGSMSNVALASAGASVDTLVQGVIDPDGRDTRQYKGEGLFITPVSGGRKALIYDVRDPANPAVVLATVRVEIELTPTVLRPVETTDPSTLALGPVPATAYVKNYKLLVAPGTSQALSARADYDLLIQKTKAVDATPKSITIECMALQKKAIDWGLTPLDAVLLTYEGIADAKQQAAGDEDLMGLLNRQRCIPEEQVASLSQLNRPWSVAIIALKFPPTEVENLGFQLVPVSSQPANPVVITRFENDVEILGKSQALKFSGSFMVPRDQVLSTLKAEAPSRFCCVAGESSKGRTTLAMDLAPAGAAEANWVIVEFKTMTDVKVAQIVLRPPEEAELTLINSKWPKQTTTAANAPPTQPNAAPSPTTPASHTP